MLRSLWVKLIDGFETMRYLGLRGHRMNRRDFVKSILAAPVAAAIAVDAEAVLTDKALVGREFNQGLVDQLVSELHFVDYSRLEYCKKSGRTHLFCRYTDRYGEIHVRSDVVLQPASEGNIRFKLQQVNEHWLQLYWQYRTKAELSE